MTGTPRSPDLVVEPGRRMDALPSLALQREVLAEPWSMLVTRPEELTVTVEQREAFIERARNSLSETFVVARLPGHRVVGWMKVDVVPLVRLAHVGRMEMVVGARWRGMGIGSALFDAAIDRARAGGVLRKLSLAVMADNEHGIRIYRQRGFVEEGRRVGEVRMEDGSFRDDVLMALTL